MQLLPIVERELRVAARRRSAFVARVAAAVGAVAVGAFQLWISGDWAGGQAHGRQLFEVLSMLAFALCLAAGPAFTADALSEEKREGTLGLLFLTDLKAPAIVFGKLAAASVTAVFSVWAVLPVVAVSLLLGGVSLAEFGRVVLVLLNTLWFSLSAGILMSSLCEEGRSAFALTGFALFLGAAVAPWLAPMLEALTPSAALILAPFNPLAAYRFSSATAYAANPETFWIGLVGLHLVSWLALGGAGAVTTRAWREATAWRLSETWQRRWQELVLGEQGVRRALRQRLLDTNPILWLGSRQRLKRTLLGGACVAALALWLGARLVLDWHFWSAGATMLVGMFFQVMLKWLAASEAAARFAEDRRNGALELLLTTPLTPDQIVRGQMLAMRRLFALPVLGVLAVELVLLFLTTPVAGDTAWIPALVTMGLFVWDMPTLAWAGMWFSVSGRKPHLASMRAVYRVLVVPWLILLAVLFVVGVWSWTAVVVAWVLICGINNHLVRATARHQLLAHLREAAAGLPRTRAPARAGEASPAPPGGVAARLEPQASE